MTLTGVDDPLIDGSRTTIVTVSVDDANSDDHFDLVADQTVTVTTTDSGDIADFALSRTTLTVSEAGTTDSFTVVLTAAPMANVVLLVTSGDTSEATVAPASLTFTGRIGTCRKP